MADSSRASAPAPASSEFLESIESLVLQADDDIESIRNAHGAYACLEKLILPQRVNDTEHMHPTRSELGALMGLLNEELRRCIDAAGTTIGSLHHAARQPSQQVLVDHQ
jgi:arsenate reductase-like glutaredoxin family protein